MSDYLFKSYQIGFEVDHYRIGMELSKLNPIWPYFHTFEELKKEIGEDFDPETVLYCLSNDQIVGFTFFDITSSNEEGVVKAWLTYPKVLPGHEEAIPLFIHHAIDVMKKKGVNIVRTRASTMWENSFEIIEQCGFKEHEEYKRGIKVYSVYNLDKGPLNVAVDSTVEVGECTTEEEFDQCAEIATHWYNKPKDWVKNHLKEVFTPEFTIAHLFIKEDNKVQSACIIAPNEFVKTIAAFYYIYSPNELYLKPLVARAISICIEKGYKTLVVDLIRKHRGFEEFYAELGFKKEAEFGYYEKEL
ncbi:MAG: hypothetical protein ACXAC7_05340 [Candidatus Hodarchaeales archaeon]|jgi:hypothetical protein